MTNFNKLASRLDKIATTLEDKGFEAEATEVDSVANALDEASKLAFAPTREEVTDGALTAKQRETIAEYLDDAIQTLYTTDIGSSGAVNGLYRFWMQNKRNFTDTTSNPALVLEAQPVKTFLNWLATGHDKLIPDKYFSRGKNDRGSTWDMLGSFLDILKEAPKAPSKNRIDLKDFMEKEKLNKDTPKSFNPALESLFTKEAAFHDVPKQFQGVIGLLYALKKKGTSNGNYSQPNFRR